MAFSVILGACLYAAVQFVWYSPWGVGKWWLALTGSTPERAMAGLRTPTLKSESVLQIVAPALLMSAALHVLDLTLAAFSGVVFWGAVGGLMLLTAGPKYWRLSRGSRSDLRLALLGDGALFLSLFLLALFVSVVGHRVY